MSTKHLYNTPDGLVLKSLQGAVSLNPTLCLHAPSKSVYIHPTHRTPNTVSVISGGGAGHEPAHAGYTGRGMLTACVSGEVFASPSAKQIGHTIELASVGGDSGKDVLVIINNYTGDRLNFGLAIEKAKARRSAEGRTTGVDSVVVADDVSLLPSESAVGPRGLGGNILVCKILGAFAERGAPLDACKRLGDAVVDNLRSIGVGLECCHVPGRTQPEGGGRLGEEECELGLGLHNEPGVRKMKVPDIPEELVGEMLGKVLEFVMDEKEGVKKDEVVLFVNNLGGMSQLEMGAVVSDAKEYLVRRNISPLRVLSSSYMTSLNAPGFSLSLLKVSRIHVPLPDVDILGLIDDPTDAVSWVGSRPHWSTVQQEVEPQTLPVRKETKSSQTTKFWTDADLSPDLIKRGIISACRKVLSVEGELTEYDTVVGDGDCGVTFARGANAIISVLESGELNVGSMDSSELVAKLGDILEDNMGGTIGALMAILFAAWSSALSARSSSFAGSLSTALESLSKHTPAKPGDRTIIDALHPFCTTLEKGSGFDKAVQAARRGADSTRGMKARLGRAVYVGQGDDTREKELPPDPGAWGILAVVEGFREGVSGIGLRVQ
ncbi:hypothetical protein VNI00_013674 [Paramarasmius palmivorus]|uniref:Dihydroxyacetone kinase n=1 Tax=Paramarasmius palmivorus TaxID=297713 RepID=A0AAW0BY54_9AGAR